MFPCCCAQPESEHFLLSCMVGMRYDSLYIEDNDGTVLADEGATLHEVQITPIGLFALRSRYPGFWVARDQFYNTPGECAVRFRLAKDTDPYTSTDVLASRTECDFPGYAARAPYGNVVSSCRDLCPPVYVASWLGSGFQVRRWWHPALDCLVQWSVTTNYFGSPFGTTFGQYEYFPYECTDEEESHTIRGVFLNWPATWTYGDPGYADCLAQYKLKYPVTLTPESEGGAYSNWYGITVEHRAYVEPINMAEGCLPAPFNQSLAVLADHPDRHLNHLAITDQGLRAMALMLTTPIDQWQLALYSNDVTPSSHSVIDDFTLYPASTGIGLTPPVQSLYPELDDTWVHDEDGERKGSIYKQGFHYLQGTQELLDIGSSPSWSLPVTANVYGWVMMARVSPSNPNVLIAAGRFPGAPFNLTHARYDPFIVRLRLRFDVWEHFSDAVTDRNCPYNTTGAGLMAPEHMAADAEPYSTKECYAVWTTPTAEDALVIRLHTGDPGEGGGANQYSGGSYSELYPSWGSASGGYRAMTSPLVFEGVASEAVTWASLWAYDWDLSEYVWIGNAELQGDTAFGLDDKLTMVAGSTKYAVP